MDYEIKRYRNGKLDGTASWDNVPVETAIITVKDWVETGFADSVEIVDGTGYLIFAHPKEADNA